jgi:hypothetical protein
MLARHSAQFAVKPLRIAPRQLRHAAHPEQLKIAHHSWTNRNQIPKPPVFHCHENLLDKFSKPF